MTQKEQVIKLIKTTDLQISTIAKVVGTDLRYAQHVANVHYKKERAELREKLWKKPRPERAKIKADETKSFALRALRNMTCPVQKRRWVAFLKAHRDLPANAPADSVVLLAERFGPIRAQK